MRNETAIHPSNNETANVTNNATLIRTNNSSDNRNGNGTMKLLILTCLIGNPLHFKGTAIEISKRYKQVSANKEKYAEKHSNIDYLEVHFNESLIQTNKQNTNKKWREEVSNKWSKPFVIKSVLTDAKYDKYEYIFWMDVDAAFMNCSISIIDLIIPNEKKI